MENRHVAGCRHPGRNPNLGRLGATRLKRYRYQRFIGWLLLGKDDRLDAGDFEALSATDILAGHQIVFAEHVGAGFGEARAVALIGAASELALLGAHHPGDFILSGLVAVRTV